MYRSTIATAVKSLQAIKSTGVIVQVSPSTMLEIVAKSDKPLIITSQNKSRLFGTDYLYLSPYRGIYLFVESKEPLEFSEDIELIVASEMWIPRI